MDTINHHIFNIPTTSLLLWMLSARSIYVFLRDHTDTPFHLDILASPSKEKIREEHVLGVNEVRRKTIVIAMVAVSIILFSIFNSDPIATALGFVKSCTEISPFLLFQPLYRINATFPYFPPAVAKVKSPPAYIPVTTLLSRSMYSEGGASMRVRCPCAIWCRILARVHGIGMAVLHIDHFGCPQ